MKPIRIQRKRTEGWRMPENTIYVGRPSHWGNPYQVGMPAPSWMNRISLDSIYFCVVAYRHLCETSPGKILEIRSFLRGHNLACWCRLDHICHADVLLEIANQ